MPKGDENGIEQNLEDPPLIKSFNTSPSSNRDGCFSKNQCPWKERESRVDDFLQQESLERPRGFPSQDNQSPRDFKGESMKEDNQLLKERSSAEKLGRVSKRYTSVC
ncbi:hypothetical protein U1Q18_028353 [Sarracenia purpurea var. burkii]